MVSSVVWWPQVNTKQGRRSTISRCRHRHRGGRHFHRYCHRVLRRPIAARYLFGYLFWESFNGPLFVYCGVSHVDDDFHVAHGQQRYEPRGRAQFSRRQEASAPPLSAPIIGNFFFAIPMLIFC